MSRYQTISGVEYLLSSRQPPFPLTFGSGWIIIRAANLFVRGEWLMTHVQKRGLCWLIAAVMTAALMIFVLTSTDVLYATNDDTAIMRAMMGFETGEPARFHLFVHGLLLWLLGWLGTIFPALPWFSYAQMAMLALSCLIIAKSIMQSFLKYRKPLWLGAVMAAVFLLTLCMKHITSLTFTLTSALLGAAAVAQMLSIEHDRGSGRVILGMVGSLALVCLSYLMRLDALWPVVGYCGLVFLLQVWEHYGLGRKAKRALRPMVVSLVIIAVALGGVVGIRQYEVTRPGVQDYLAWQESRTEIMDYIGIANVPQEAFEALGWSDAVIDMAKVWCFLDSDISTEAFATLAEYSRAQDERSAAERLQRGWEVLTTTLRDAPLDAACLVTALIAAAAAFLCACFCRGRRLRLLVSIGSLTLSAAAMIAVLAVVERLPMRAMLMILLPACAALFALLPACEPSRVKWPLIACAAACALYTGYCLSLLLPELLVDEDQDLLLGSAMTDLEEYALFEPESLFIYDDTLIGSDLRVFPDYSEGMPDNIAFWGGWGLRSPESVEQFGRFGIDLNDFDPCALLRDDVYFASGRIDPPPTVILEWLREKIGPNVDYEIYSEYGYVYIFRFYEY